MTTTSLSVRDRFMQLARGKPVLAALKARKEKAALEVEKAALDLEDATAEEDFVTGIYQQIIGLLDELAGAAETVENYTSRLRALVEQYKGDLEAAWSDGEDEEDKVAEEAPS